MVNGYFIEPERKRMTQALAGKIRGLIQANKLSVQGLEKKAGLKINAVRNILTGHSKKPSAETLLAVAKALNCSISDLLGEDGPDEQRGTSNKNMVFSHHKLLSDIMTHVIAEFEMNHEEVKTGDLISLSQEIYKYSCENNENQLDLKFASWLLKKHFD